MLKGVRDENVRYFGSIRFSWWKVRHERFPRGRWKCDDLALDGLAIDWRRALRGRSGIETFNVVSVLRRGRDRVGGVMKHWEDRATFEENEAYVKHRAGARIHPCPTCKKPAKLSDKDVRNGYQCDECADREESLF